MESNRQTKLQESAKNGSGNDRSKTPTTQSPRDQRKNTNVKLEQEEQKGSRRDATPQKAQINSSGQKIKEPTKSARKNSQSIDKSAQKAKKGPQSQSMNISSQARSSQDFGNDETGELRQNRDHCNICKDGGDLLCCDNCPRSFHTKCVGLKSIPEDDWYCKRCVPIMDKRKHTDEEKRKRAQEREKILEDKRLQKERENREKEQEFEKKREEKRLEKERQEEEKQKIRQQKLDEIAAQKAQKQAELLAQQEEKRLKLEQEKQEKSQLIEQQRLQKLEEKQKLQEQKQQEMEQKKQQLLLVKNDKSRQKSQSSGVSSQQGVKIENDSKSISPFRNGRPSGKQSPAREEGVQEDNGANEQQNLDQQTANVTQVISQPKKQPVKGQANGGIPSNQKKSEEKSEAEKAKEARAREMKTQLKIFARIYPELVEKHSIKYPIEDKLIKKMPLLHGADNFPQKPQLKQVLLNGPQFERLLYIWEFLNNFGDFMNLTPFKFEELQIALSFTQRNDQVQLYSQPENPDEEPDWEHQINNKTVSEQGFGLINSIHVSIYNVFMNELKHLEEKTKAANEASNKENIDEEEDNLIEEIRKTVDKPENIWPELIRLIMKQQKRFDFYPLDQHIASICDKLATCSPESYSNKLTYEEKTELLEVLIDGIHDLDDFRVFLNQRVEEKSSFNKQKMDIYAEIKQLENQKQEIVKEHAQNNFFNNSEEILNKIDELKKQLAGATRIQSRTIWNQINELQSEKNKILKEMQKIEDQIEKRQNKIERLNEQAHKTSIKTSMLGKDADKNEYWFFKEEPGKLFVKKYEEVKNQKPVTQDVQMVDEEQINTDTIKQQDQQMHEDEFDAEAIEVIFKWYYYDQEEEFERLIEACNLKGIRERKLQENLRKIRDRLKLKKSRKQAAAAAAAATQANALGDQLKQEEVSQDMKEETAVQEQQKKEDIEMEEEEVEEVQEKKHVIFENDNYYQALNNSIWYNKKMPTKRQYLMENKAMPSRGGRGVQQKQPYPQEEKITFENVKQQLLGLEELYTDSNLQFQREWDFKHVRDKVKEQIFEAQTVDDLSQVLLKLDEGFCSPHSLKYVNNKDDQDQQNNDQEDEEGGNQSEFIKDQNEESKNINDGENGLDKNVKVQKLFFIKFWATKELRESWRQYVFGECCFGNVNALFIAVKILEKTVGQSIQRSLDAQYKKQKKEQAKQGQTRGGAQPSTKMQNQQDKSASRKSKSYKQFFDDEEDDDSEDERSNERSRRSAKPAAKAKSKGGKKKMYLESDDESDLDSMQGESEVDEDEVDEEDDDEESKQWDEACYKCNKGGKVLCCESCNHVCHLSCSGLLKKPLDEWHCEECLIQQTRKRTTRGTTNLYIKPKNQIGGRYR